MGTSLKTFRVGTEIYDSSCTGERDIKEKIFNDNPFPNVIKGRPSIDTSIKDSSKTLTLNHEDTLKSSR